MLILNGNVPWCLYLKFSFRGRPDNGKHLGVGTPPTGISLLVDVLMAIDLVAGEFTGIDS